jgi:ATP-dependent RNA helicase RhlB
MGFIKDLRYILRQLPPFDKRQTMLFSATLSARVMELAYEFMDLAERVKITPEQVTVERVEQILYHVSRREKFPFLLGLLRREEDFERVLLFVNTKKEAEHLAERLTANDCKAAVISGDIDQRKRLRLLEDFRSDRLRFLVATDVASRGLHIDDVSHVINYDLPQEAEDYVHRIGRTARAGARGKAISLADEDLVFHLPEIEEYIGIKIPSEFPAETDFFWDYRRTPHRRKAPVPEKTPPADGKPKRRRSPHRRGKESGGRPPGGSS